MSGSGIARGQPCWQAACSSSLARPVRLGETAPAGRMWAVKEAVRAPARQSRPVWVSTSWARAVQATGAQPVVPEATAALAVWVGTRGARAAQAWAAPRVVREALAALGRAVRVERVARQPEVGRLGRLAPIRCRQMAHCAASNPRPVPTYLLTVARARANWVSRLTTSATAGTGILCATMSIPSATSPRIVIALDRAPRSPSRANGNPLQRSAGRHAARRGARVAGRELVCCDLARLHIYSLWSACDPTPGPPTVTATFSGTFHSWFLDGQRFLATTGTTVRVYSLRRRRPEAVDGDHHARIAEIITLPWESRGPCGRQCSGPSP
jgi:hypothetical protein